MNFTILMTQKYLLLGLVLTFICLSCNKESTLGELDFLDIQGDSLVNAVFDNAEKYELQIRYVKIDRTKEGIAKLTPYEFRTDSRTYFYPASTVKMPVAFLALEKLNRLQKEGVDIDFNSPLQIDSVRSPQSPVQSDSTSLDNKASIAHYIHKLFIVSDNDAYNRLYEFIGPEEINRALRSKGIFRNSRIVHRVGISGFSPEENLHTNPFTFYRNDEVVYRQEAQHMKEAQFEELENTLKGVAYLDGEGKRVDEAFDFAKKNYISIQDLQESLISIILQDEKFDLTKEDYDLLYKSMSIFPKASKAPIYDKEYYYDSYVKFFMYGDNKAPMPSSVRIFNKVGFAYGYLTDCAYIVDFEKNIEFFLAATIHVNENQTYNDGVYEYDELGIPFLAKLGQKFYDYEKNRKREYFPDLEKLRLTY